MKFYGIRSLGKFWVQRVNNTNNEIHRGEIDEGRLLYDETDQHLYAGSESKWLRISTPYDIFSLGTKILFCSYPLPDTWNIDITNDDKTILTTNASGSVFTNSGAWSISGLQSDGQHNHGYRTGGPTANSSQIGISDAYAYGVRTNHTHVITSDGDHQHFFDGTWRPAYIVSVVATRV